MKDRLIAIVILIIMVLNTFDVMTDVTLGVPMWHIVEESLIVLMSAVAAGYLIVDIRRRSRRLKALSNQLKLTKSELDTMHADARKARADFSEFVQRQFNDWGLSDGEKQVGLLLLKGLSLREIAAVRNTAEKTVRHQASAIYQKSGLEGRHTFSAWFLEDFMDVSPGLATTTSRVA